MKKILVFLILLTCIASTTQASLTYGPDNYRSHLSYVGSGNKYLDPVYLFMNEVDDLDLEGVISGTGEKFYVDSGVTEGAGTSWAAAKNTIDAAINLCTANRGDVIYVAQGHAENISGAAGVACDLAGITIIGCGNGDDMPELSFTAATSTFSISAADVTVKDIRFLGNYTNGVTECIDVSATGDGARIIDCEFKETTSDKELLKMITLSADADRCVISNNRFLGEAGGADSVAINLEGGSDKTIINGNTFIGDWSGYVIDGTAAASTELAVFSNYIHNADTGAGKTMAFNASTTGGLISNACYGNGSSFALVGDAMFVSPDNIVMATENVETRNYETMFGAYRGDAAGTAGDSIYADFVLAQSDLDAILADTAAMDSSTELRTLLYGSDTAGATAAKQDTAQSDLDIITGTSGVVIATDTINADALAADALAEIEAEATDAIEADLLDKLVAAADADSPVNGSIIADLASKDATSDWTSYNNQTDSLEAIRDTIDTITGIGFRGTCIANATTTEADCPDLAGFGNDYFNTGWSLIVVKNASGVGTEPEGKIIDIIDYVSTTGTFTLNVATTEVINADDEIYVRRTEDLNLDTPTILGSAGTIRYVDSGTSGDGSGLTWENAYATLALAEAACSAGDVIYVADGHNENITTGGDTIDVANISVIGIGEGDGRPLFDFDAGADELTLNAAGIVLKNLRLRPGATDVVAGIVVGADGDGVLIENCAFIDGEAADEEFRDCISVNTAAVGLTVKDCTYENSSATAADQDTFVNLDAATIANPSIIGCRIFGTFAEAPIWAFTAIPTNVLIKDNIITNTTTGQLAIEFQGNATGWLVGNKVSTDAILTSVDPGLMSVDESTVWSDYGVADVTAVPVFTNNTGVNRWGATELAQIEGEVDDGITANLAIVAIQDDLTDIDANTTAILVDTGTTIPATLSILEAAAAPSYSHTNYLAVSTGVFDTTGVWSTTTAHEIAVVTGCVRMTIIAECTVDVNSVGDNGTISLGDETTVNSIIAASTIGIGTMAKGELWVDATLTKTILTRTQLDAVEFAVCDGKDIGYTVATNALEAGTIVFHIYWTPLDSTGDVTAGAGGAF